MGDKWRSLLTHLGVPLTKSKTFLQECQGNPVSACLEGLVFWRDGNKPCKKATWGVLLEALEEGAERRDYAEKLREDIIKGATTQNSVSSVATQSEPQSIASNLLSFKTFMASTVLTHKPCSCSISHGQTFCQ